MAEYTLMYTIEVYFVTLGLTTFAHVLRLLHINCETASAEKCSMDLTKSTALQTLLYPVKPTWAPTSSIRPSAAAYFCKTHHLQPQCHDQNAVLLILEGLLLQ